MKLRKSNQKLKLQYHAEKKAGVALNERMDLLRSRAELLSGWQRVLLDLMLNSSCSKKELACLVGISAQSLSRRVEKLLYLLSGSTMESIRLVQNMSSLEMAIARRYFLLRQSQQKIAIITGLSLYRIKKILAKMQLPQDEGMKDNNRDNSVCAS